jgi:hypothetical protein
MMSRVFYHFAFTLIFITKQSQEILGIAIPDVNNRKKQAVLGHYANLPFYLPLHKAKLPDLTKEGHLTLLLTLHLTKLFPIPKATFSTFSLFVRVARFEPLIS